MAARPHDIVDLYLAPVALGVDERLAELARLSQAELFVQVSLSTDREPVSTEERRRGLLLTVTHLLELHDWEPAWDEGGRGLRLSHGGHSLTLGITPNLREFLET
ncbi:hypothetical protein [Longivirga aurantiaca]|uniref:Uncharacterized protein n=1 Tax=Longivirga aurantiaca TaxID=1837743 RepID=A0ABW1T597_9ACTN